MDEMPVFVKIDDYKQIVDVLHVTQEKLRKAKLLLAKINELKAQEDAEIDTWTNEVEEIDERLEHVNKTLLEPEM